jgi:molecular chaperone GrpE
MAEGGPVPDFIEQEMSGFASVFWKYFGFFLTFIHQISIFYTAGCFQNSFENTPAFPIKYFIQEVSMSKHDSHSGQKPVDSLSQEQPSVKAASADVNMAENAAAKTEEGSAVENAAAKADDKAVEGSPEDKIAELEAQLADAKDQFLRKAADFENFRKRMNQEKQNAIDFANQSLLLDLIPIIDDFERAIHAATAVAAATTVADAALAANPAGDPQAAPAGNTAADTAAQSAPDSLLEGINMIEKRLISQLESKWGLKRFDSAGEPFDPNRHEALMMEKSAEITEPVVKEDLLKGYMLKDRVIRSAKVKVLMPETSSAG